MILYAPDGTLANAHCTLYQVPVALKVPCTWVPATWYLLPSTQVPGMKIVPGTRKHASATAGASWNCCESSRCKQLDYVLPLTLAPAFSLSSDSQTSWKKCQTLALEEPVSQQPILGCPVSLPAQGLLRLPP